jgi:hypothetical protein
VQRDDSRGGGFVGAGLVFVSLALVVASITVVFLSMRAVMEIGGVCAEGGPFVPRQPCPDGVPLLLVGGIWTGTIFAFAYVWQVVRLQVPNFAWALWPALFLSLGWNFLEYGLDPPGGEGVAWGWLVCAVVFFFMGLGPLLAALPAVWRTLSGAAPPPSPREAPRPPGARAVAATYRSIRESRPSASTTVAEPPAGATDASEGEPAGGGQPDDVVSALERLHYLHRTGAIDDAEYETAKDRILGGSS